MGGHLTVSSKEHCGSTFTFILPYKVSIACDNSDDPDDELSDMENDDASSDDAMQGFFQFQPRTLGSLFSSNGISRAPKLSPHKLGLAVSHNLNGFSQNSYSLPSNNVTSNGIQVTVTDESEMSESSGSLVTEKPEIEKENVLCRDKKLQDNNTSAPLQNGIAREIGVETKVSKTQQSNETQEIDNKGSQCVTSRSSSSNSDSTSAMVKSPLEPKILLVEDNNVNVMVARTMMKQLGHSMDVVNNGVEAVRAVQSRSYDLILMVLIQA